MEAKYIIVGTGFRGFCDALHLLKSGKTNIHMFDVAPFFGGVMNSFEFNGFYIDKGVHIFSDIPESLASSIFEIMDGKIKEVQEKSASALNKKITNNFALPDLSSLDNSELCQKIHEDLVGVLSDSEISDDFSSNLSKVFSARYGETAAEVFSLIFESVYKISPKKIAPEALPRTPFGRLKFLDDQSMLELKENPIWDETLAVSRGVLSGSDAKSSFYPDVKKGMAGWCEYLKRWLEKKGVQIHLDIGIRKITESKEKVVFETDRGKFSSDHVIWSNENMNSLSGYVGLESDVDQFNHGTDLVLFTLVTDFSDICEMTYIQNFDTSALAFRIAANGPFTDQIRSDGMSFVTCECPTSISHDLWQNPEKYVSNIWSECCDLGVVRSRARLAEYDIKKIPKCYKLPKVGYIERHAEFLSDMAEKHPRIRVRDANSFSRRDIYLDKKHLAGLI